VDARATYFLRNVGRASTPAAGLQTRAR
jgi:hypothetical protein